MKFPYCKKDEMLDVEDNIFYLKRERNGSMKLDRNHAYFYQIQIHHCVSMMESSYFVACTENAMHFEEISFD